MLDPGGVTSRRIHPDISPCEFPSRDVRTSSLPELGNIALARFAPGIYRGPTATHAGVSPGVNLVVTATTDGGFV
jgi:hypothetical protein